MRTAEAARGKWPAILSALGMEDLHMGVNKPCPMCGGDDRFSFYDKDGEGSYFCRHCGGGDGLSLAVGMLGKPFADVAKKIDGMVGNIQQKKISTPGTDPRKKLREVHAGLVRNHPVVNRYLAARGFNPCENIYGHNGIKYWKTDTGKPELVGTYPAMVCLISGPDGSSQSFHITHLNQNGKKARVPNVKKIMRPVSTISGGAVRLFRYEDMLGIAEGIETALAVHKRFGVPCWAALNANNLEKFVPPAGLRKLVVFGDNDQSYTGQKAAYSLAHKLIQNGLDVSVEIPEQINTDWADFEE